MADDSLWHLVLFIMISLFTLSFLISICLTPNLKISISYAIGFILLACLLLLPGRYHEYAFSVLTLNLFGLPCLAGLLLGSEVKRLFLFFIGRHDKF
jgi:hypothetical protein